MARFINKVVVVSGAGSVGPGWGNGRAIAVQMVEEGAHVLALDRDLARMDETLALAQQAALTSGGSIAGHGLRCHALRGHQGLR